MIPHLNLNPDYTFGISIAVITVFLAAYGVYKGFFANENLTDPWDCLLYTSPSPRDRTRSRMPSSA